MGARRPELLDARALAWLAALAAAVYAGSLPGAFHFDDFHSLVDNPHIRSLANVPAFFVDPSLFSANEGSQMYRPLVLTSYALNYALGGYAPAGFALFNLAVHIGVVCLAGLLWAALGAPRRAALGAALVLALTPLATEPVNYISARAESMALLCVLAAARAYVGRWPRPVPWGLLFFAAGLACKSTAIALPALLWAYEGCIRCHWMQCWRRLAPYGALALAYVLLVRQLLAEALLTSAVRPLDAHAYTQLKALVYYLKLAFFPWPLSVEHQFAVAAGPGAPAVLGAALLAGSLLWLLWRAAPRVRFWGLWSLIALAPSIAVPLNVLVNERRLYPVLVGLCGLGIEGWRAGRRWPRHCWALAAAALVCWGALTVRRNAVWAGEERLWLDARAHAPLMVRPHIRLGSYYREQGRLQEARASFVRALELDSGNGAAHNNLGNLQSAQGQWEDAERSYRQALEAAPNYLEALINLGTLYSRRGRHAEALELFERAVPLGPHSPGLYNNLGTAYLRLERYAEAEKALRRALELERSGTALFNLGGALEGQGKAAQAEDVYREALRLEPENAKPLYNLALLQEREGRPYEAAQSYRRFLALWQGDERATAFARRRLEALGAAP